MEKSGAERLSFTSECFDPNLALKSAKAIPTPLKSKIFSNLNKYVDSLRQSASFKSLGWLPKGIVEESGNRSTEIAQLKKKSECKEDGIVANRIQKLQKLLTTEIKEEVKKRPRHRPDVVQRMEGLKNGPYSILYNCMSKGLKMKVWTRRCAGLRGACTGYLVAFDKHMNLAMIDVDEVYALEVCTLSIEKQHQIQKEKKARKRCRNRLNRINGFIRTNDSECQRGLESAVGELLQEKGEMNVSLSHLMQRSALCFTERLIEICHFGNFMNTARKKVIERAEDLTEPTCTFKGKSYNVVKDDYFKSDTVVSNENQSTAPSSSPLIDKAKHSSIVDNSKDPNLVQDSDSSGTSEKSYLHPRITTENEPHLLLEPQRTFRDHDRGKKPGRTLNSHTCKDSQSINIDAGQNGSFVDGMCGVLAEGDTTYSFSEKPNIRDFRNRKSHVFQRRHINQLFIRGDNIALISYEL